MILKQQIIDNIILTLIYIVTISLIVIFVAGCGTNYEYMTYQDGKLVKSEKVSADIIGSVMESTKGKTVMIFRRGWACGFEVSPGTPENPTAHAKFLCGKYFDAWMSILPDMKDADWDGISKTIEAMDAPLTASTAGVSEGK